MRNNVQADTAARIDIDGSTVGGGITTNKAVAVEVTKKLWGVTRHWDGQWGFELVLPHTVETVT